MAVWRAPFSAPRNGPRDGFRTGRARQAMLRAGWSARTLRTSSCAHAFDQPATFAGKGRARLRSRSVSEIRAAEPASFLRRRLDLADQMAVLRYRGCRFPRRWRVLMRRISRPGWLSMLTMREPGARVKFDGSCVGAFLPPPANFITAPTTSAIRARIIRLERIITAIFAAFSAGLFCGSGRMSDIKSSRDGSLRQVTADEPMRDIVWTVSWPIRLAICPGPASSNCWAKAASPAMA